MPKELALPAQEVLECDCESDSELDFEFEFKQQCGMLNAAVYCCCMCCTRKFLLQSSQRLLVHQLAFSAVGRWPCNRPPLSAVQKEGNLIKNFN
ncbi:hypothetical protein ACLKA7_009963 [Drosophila subpalustris]